MDNRTAKKGDVLARMDCNLDNLWYITDGSVTMKSGAYSIALKKGDFIGIADFDTGVHTYDYVASADTQVMNFSGRENLFTTNFYSAKPENCRALALSLNHILRDSYVALNSLCSQSEKLSKLLMDSYSKYCEYTRELHASVDVMAGMDEVPESVSLSLNQKLLYQAHKGMYTQLSGKETSAAIISSGMIPGYMIHAVGDLKEVSSNIEFAFSCVNEAALMLMNEAEDDVYGRLGSIAIRATSGHPLYEQIISVMDSIYDAIHETNPELADMRRASFEARSANMTVSSTGEEGEAVDESASSQLIDSMNTIFEFAGFPSDKAAKLKDAINAFKKVADPFSSEDEVRRMRMTIEEHFYQLYLLVLEKRASSKTVPVIIKMFLDFGYLDEELAGMENACELYNICLTFEGDKSKGVYTASEWLLAILRGDKVPSINEFEQNFEEYVREQVTSGRIPEKQVKAILADRGQKVLFELQNMFRRTSKICSGQILAFNPVFSDYQTMRKPKEDLLDPHLIMEAIEKVKNIDYTLFYRETMCVFSEKENIHDMIHVEVMPDIILMPVVGCRGSMWQEISGRDRTTPARMMFPVINTENLEKILLKVLGEYRWEICKRMQGMRWNDVTDPSLTSLYYDYLQFYRKNSEISTEQKEKIKIGLQRFKQNFKDYFVSDYMEYIKYESSGSPHLNKIARSILFAHCPFTSAIRAKLADNPIYAEVSERYRIKTGQQLHKLDNIVKKLNSRGQDVSPELLKEIEYYKL